MENGNEYLNSTDIARILGVDPHTIIKMLKDGRIKHSQISSRSRRVDPIDLIIYLEKIGNHPMAMAGFKRDIYKFLYSKYGNAEYWKEIGKQEKLFREYVVEREEARIK